MSAGSSGGCSGGLPKIIGSASATWGCECAAAPAGAAAGVRAHEARGSEGSLEGGYAGSLIFGVSFGQFLMICI